MNVEQMRTRVFTYYRFVLMRAWKNDHIGVIVLCFFLAAALASVLAALSQYRAAREAFAEVTLTSRRLGSSANVHSPYTNAYPFLNPFRSNELLDALNGAATTLALPVNEMVFRFDDNASHPYLRYSATVKLFGGYPAVRKFVDAVRKPLPQTSLDAISCSRTDIRSVHISCELTLSTFYRRSSHE